MATITSSAGALDVNSIVSQLMQVEAAPITKLQRVEASYQTKLSAWGTLKSALSTFQTAMSDLGSVSSFRKAKVASSDDATVAATVSDTAAAGTYAIVPTAFASAHTLSSGEFDATTSTVGSGSLTFQFGTISGSTFTQNPARSTKTVTIASGQNTLAGIRDAVNAANIGVSASIVNDGSKNHLVFVSKSGEANAMRITASDDDLAHTDNAGLSQLAYDPAGALGTGKNLSQLQAGASAAATVNGLPVTSDSNTFSSAVEGLSFTIKKASASAINLTISSDTSGATSSANNFAKAYNDLKKTITELTKYDATGQSGPLQGEFSATALLAQLRGTITQTVSGGTTGYSRLSDIGIQMTDKGDLKVDTTKLASKVSADANKVYQLFGRIATSTDSGVSFVSAESSTQGGTYAVSITQPATRGTLEGSAAPGLTIDGSNNTLALTIDGTSASLTLDSQTYGSDSAFASDLQARINGLSTFTEKGIQVAVTVSGGNIKIESQTYGASSTVAASGNAVANLLGGAPVTTDGLDVAGTIDGVAATGSGQNLTSASGDSSGLKLLVTATSAGSHGSVTFVDGQAKRLQSWAENALASDGTIKAKTDGLNALIKTNQKKITQLSDKLALMETRYRQQYSKLNTLLSNMSTTSSYLTQQIAQLQANSGN